MAGWGHGPDLDEQAGVTVPADRQDDGTAGIIDKATQAAAISRIASHA